MKKLCTFVIMWERIKHFFTHRHHREKLNVNHHRYLDKNLKRVDKKSVKNNQPI